MSCDDVVVRTDQAVLLAAPEREPHPVHRRDPQLRHLQRDFEDRCRTTAVVVDAGPFAHRVEVSTHHDRAVGATRRGVGEHVVRGDVADGGCHRHAQLQPGRSCAHEIGAEREGRTDDRDRQRRRVERAEEGVDAIGGVALVEDHDRRGAGRLSVLGLQTERARPSGQQRDVARREAGEVGRFTAAGGSARRRECDVDHRDGSGDVARSGVVHGVEVVDLDVRGGRRRRLREALRHQFELRVGERLGRDDVAGVGQQAGDVGGGSDVPRCAGGAGAAVGVGDRLERLEVLHDAVGRDGGAECGGVGAVVGDRGKAGGRGRETDSEREDGKPS